MAVADYFDTIQKIYIAFYQRPADPAGLKYWAQRVDAANGSLAEVIDAFANSAEAAALYGEITGETIGDIVDAIYQALFNRAPDAAGKQFYVDAFNAGEITAGKIALAVLDGSQGDDLVAINNKLAVANIFTAKVDGRPLSDAFFGTGTNFDVTYNGNDDAAAARTILAAVTSNPSTVLNESGVVAALQEKIADAGDAIGGVASGQTFTLTTGADTVNGTAGNDTITSLSIKADGTAGSTLTAFDAIDGGAGTDTLNIYTDGANNGTFPASASVKNVEIINIYNAGAAGAFGDASKFEGATQLWQHTASVDVTKLAATTTAGFKGLTLSANANAAQSETVVGAADAVDATARTVTGADAATSVAIALDAVKGDAADAAAVARAVDDSTGAVNATVQNQAALNVVGAALTAVTVSGSLAKATTTAGSNDATLALNVTVAKDAQSATVNSAVATTLTIENAVGSTKDLTTVDASASAGAITYTSADNKVSTIKTGAGKDTVTVTTVTSNTVGAVVNALVETGAGDDVINVNTSGTGTTTVNAGAGDDTITLLSGVNTATRIDGGEGVDTVKLAGKTLIAEDYVLITNAISNVEKIEFTGATAAVVDASKLAEFGTFTFAGNAADKVTEASAAALVTKANLEAYSTGYKADGADADTLTDAYGGSLSVTQTGTGAIKLYADSANLTVKAGTAGVNSTVTGDVNSLTVTLTNGANSTTAPTADTLTTLALNASTSNEVMSSLTLKGNGTATVTGGDKLVTIDASGLGGTLAYGATAGNITGGLDFTADADVAESITLGSGTDTVRLGVTSTYSKMDTITGFDAVKETNDLKSTTDVIVFDGVTLNGLAAGQATKVTLTASATTLDLAFVEAAAADATTAGVAFFQFEGNTYLFSNKGTAVLEDGDLAVKVVGLVDFADDWGVFAA